MIAAVLLSMQLDAADPTHASAPRAGTATEPDVAEMHRALGILNYLIGDYPIAVSTDGRVLNDFEYREQIALLEQLDAIFADAATDAAIAGAVASMRRRVEVLRQLVAEPRGVEDVLGPARDLRDTLIDDFGLELAPTSLPSLARGRALYGRACATCHGTVGRARTPVADLLDPRPTDLLSRHLDQTLSPYQTFNVVTYGIDGTAMPAFAAMSVAERWDVAFYVMAMRQRAVPRGHGARTDPALEVLARSTDAELAAWLNAQGVPASRQASEVARLRHAGGAGTGE